MLNFLDACKKTWVVVTLRLRYAMSLQFWYCKQKTNKKHPCCLICQMNQEISELHRVYYDQKRLQVALFVG